MGDLAIRIEHLSKRYRIGHRERYKALRDTLADVMYGPFRCLRAFGQRTRVPASQHSNGDNAVWALKDVSLEVKQGEVIGIIGRNGAGKSTLLKILARITRPTTGRVELYGRVGSLLEVGTGFHPELTGRENIYLNGAILGMKRVEIHRQFDEIVEFSGLERFLDTPVKYYSTGMYMRLAFAVAAHLDPEILLVDEVLAVGDAEFQQKCLGKMREVAKGGRTVLFVSHNMAAMQNLCQHGLVLDAGSLVVNGSVEEAVNAYILTETRRAETGGVGDLTVEHFRLLSWDFAQMNGLPLQPLKPAILKFRVSSCKSLRNAGVMFQVFAPDGALIFALDFRDLATMDWVPPEACVDFVFEIPSLPLIPGIYFLQVFFKNLDQTEVVRLPQPIELVVADGPVYGDRTPDALRRWFGHVAVQARAWHRTVDNGGAACHRAG